MEKPFSVKKHYIAGLAMVAGVSLFCTQLREQLDLINIALLYQLPVTMSAFWWGRWPSYFVALVSVALFNFLFIPPLYTFHVADVRYFWSLVTFMLVAYVIGGRTEWLRLEAENARQRERSTQALYEFSKGITAVMDLAFFVNRLAVQAAETLGTPIRVILPEPQNTLKVKAEWNSNAAQLPELEDLLEMEAVSCAYTTGKPSGNQTDWLPAAKGFYVPLVANQRTVGVLGIFPGEGVFSPEKQKLVDAWASLAALAIERVQLAEQAREAELLAEADKLRNALFNSISHELRTPLSSILGSVSSLLEEKGIYSEKARQELLENIQDGALRMERVVANLLDTARLESGMLQLKIDWCDLQDIIGATLQRLRERIRHFRLTVEIPDDLPLLRGDCVLLELVMLNLIDNAMKYSPRGEEVLVVANRDKERIHVSISDRGIGIPAGEVEKVFDKFYRIRRPRQVGGTGLGLSICKGIVEAHGGQIKAIARIGGGTVIQFWLPLSPIEPSQYEERDCGDAGAGTANSGRG